MRQDHTISIKDFSWTLQAMVSNFIKTDKARIASRMKADGLRTSQMARLLYGETTRNNMAKVTRLLKEVE